MRSDKIGNVFFRADGNVNMGLGHIVRSSALASAINDHFSTTLVTRCNIPNVLEEASFTYDKIIQLPQDDFLSEGTQASKIFKNADLIVLDGYAFDGAYQLGLLKQGFEFFSIDDIHATTFYSRAVINHGGGLTAFDYHAQPGAQFYLGPKYSLIRKPFLEAAKKRRGKIDNRHCFICFGGADPLNKTLEILKNEKVRNHFDQFHVVTGSAYQYLDELNEFIRSQRNIFTYSSLNPDDLVSVMQKCCFAVCSPSTLVYEYMSVGGIVFLEQIADNQKDVIKYMVQGKFAYLVKDVGCVSEQEINFSLKQQSEYFDGKADERLVKIFDQYFYARKMKIRRANNEDLLICFEWANDSLVREQSYSQNSISLQEHTKWFYQKINDRNIFFYIMQIDEMPIAQIRFQVNGNEATLGYLVDAKVRNKGLGTSVLSFGIEKFISDFQKPVDIVGFVKKSNVPSQRSFEKLAFVKTESSRYSDSFKYTMHYGN